MSASVKILDIVLTECSATLLNMTVYVILFVFVFEADLHYRLQPAPLYKKING